MRVCEICSTPKPAVSGGDYLPLGCLFLTKSILYALIIITIIILLYLSIKCLCSTNYIKTKLPQQSNLNVGSEMYSPF